MLLHLQESWTDFFVRTKKRHGQWRLSLVKKQVKSVGAVFFILFVFFVFFVFFRGHVVFLFFTHGL